MFDRTVIIMPFATGGLPLRVIRCLGPKGARFVLLSTDKENAARSSVYCREFIHTDPQPDADVLDQLLRLKSQASIEILLPVTTQGFEFVAEHRQLLSGRFRIPPISSLESLKIASDKWKLYDFSLRHNLPVLPTALLSETAISDLARGVSNIRFPALVKPSLRENGAGIRKVGSIDELRGSSEQTSGNTHDGSLIQTYVEGDDYSLSVYCEDGEIRSHTLWRAIMKSSVPYTIPHGIQFIEDARVFEIGKRLLKRLNWQGVCDIDLLVDRHSHKIWILEVNARFWGNVVACSKCGVNFPLLMTQAVNGPRPDRWPAQTGDAVFCHPKGALRGLLNPLIRRALVRHPWRSTGLDTVVRDPAPEIRRLQAKIGRILHRSTGRK